MNRQNLLIIASAVAGAAALGACSSDESYSGPTEEASGEIRFAANTESSRAGDITTNNLTAFNVYAYTGTPAAANLFMDNVEVTKTSGNTWTYSPVKYWPANENVDFYAFAPATWVGSGGPLAPVPYDATGGTEDIVYAVAPNLRGAAEQPNAQVVFNFRHALSKVTVKLSSSNENLRVRVSNVALSSIMTKGNFTFPSGSTSETASADNVGTWTDQNTPQNYVLLWSQAADELLDLTSTPTVIPTAGLGRGGTVFAMPQPLTYRSNGNGADNYIGVMCVIYDASTGTKLWPNENTPEENIVQGSTFGDGILKFPLPTSKFSAWQPGCHYIYSLVINSNEEMGAIEFGTPTVDSFIEVETSYE